MSYDLIGYRKSDLVKLDNLLAGELVEALSRIVPRERASSEGKRIVEKLKDAIPRQNFVIPVQAALGGKIIARETVRPYRKDVTSGLYGGDVTRKTNFWTNRKGDIWIDFIEAIDLKSKDTNELFKESGTAKPNSRDKFIDFDKDIQT